MFENKYPYTDFHELNLDWFLAEFKKVHDKVDSLDATVKEFTEFVTNYFDNLDVQQEINNKLDAMAADGTLTELLLPYFNEFKGEIEDIVDQQNEAISNQDETIETQNGRIAVLEGRMDTFASLTEGSTTGDAELQDIRVGADGVTYPTAGDAVREQFNHVNDVLFGDVVKYQEILRPYFYKANTWINLSTGNEESINGYDLYKIPINPGEFIYVSQTDNTNPFWQGIIHANCARFLKDDDTYIQAESGKLGMIGSLDYRGVFCGSSDCTHLMLTVKNTLSDIVRINYNRLNDKLFLPLTKYNNVFTLNASNTFGSKSYIANTTQTFYQLSGDYYVHNIRVNAGDQVAFNGSVLSGYGTFTPADLGTTILVSSQTFTAPSDGLLQIFSRTSNETTAVYYPANSIKIDASNVLNLDVHVDNPYSGLKGVAFGTSLTYRAQTTGGYLNFLPGLSGMTWDNQGLGSSTIYPNALTPQMLPMIENYTGWSDKNVCILEGFVNDWYVNGNDLGSWKDSTPTSVCGCVRYALNLILTNNPNLTVYLIMDHFGKGTTAPTATNAAGMTQLEFYQEIEKIALSMGVRVIREYEVSEISNLTPQYLLDNIHLNTLGAEQSANAIWSVMKGLHPNIQQ